MELESQSFRYVSLNLQWFAQTALLYVSFRQPVACDVDVFQGRPKLGAWRDRVRDAIGAELFNDAHQIVMGAPEKIKMVDVDKLQVLRPRVKVYL